MSLNRSFNILIAGVGGQGVILLSDIIAEVFLKAGYNVKKSELRGIAQRSGSVISHLRAGEKVYSPLIPRGEADILVAMELLEAYRWVDYLKRDALTIILDRQISPSDVSSGHSRYSTDIKGKIRRRCRKIKEISWNGISRHLGDIRFANMFMLGVLSNYFPFKIRYWEESIGRNLPDELVDLNLHVFSVGRESNA